MTHYDILIIGGGAAGIAAAKECRDQKVILADRLDALGGVLLQCAHPGFGKNKTGPEYAQNLLQDFPENITLALNTTVLSVSENRTALLCGKAFGREEVSFQELILATGCREIPAGALPIGGTRPKGVYTAGQMQERINLHKEYPQGNIVILGSGDLGLIMARHLAEAGCNVTIVEKRGACGGMAKNQHCLEEYPIRLLCCDTVVELHGEKNITGCTTAGGEFIPCSCLLIAAGLQPERELVQHLGNPRWLHICGNASKVHPMVEAVVNEGKLAGKAAVENIRGGL